jgi:hypothetical protein
MKFSVYTGTTEIKQEGSRPKWILVVNRILNSSELLKRKSFGCIKYYTRDVLVLSSNVRLIRMITSRMRWVGDVA